MDAYLALVVWVALLALTAAIVDGWKKRKAQEDSWELGRDRVIRSKKEYFDSYIKESEPEYAPRFTTWEDYTGRTLKSIREQYPDAELVMESETSRTMTIRFTPRVQSEPEPELESPRNAPGSGTVDCTTRTPEASPRAV